jgi:hypothetical protein
MYTIVMEGFNDTLSYLIVKQSDIGHYVIARCYSVNVAKVIVEALEAQDQKPPAF